MADTKISALPAASVGAAANEFAINEAGTSKKLTGALLKAFVGATLITGNSGTVNNGVAPSQTLQVLTADNADQTVLATPVTQLTASTVGVGWWLVEYFILWQSDVTTTGINFIVDHSGTAVNFQATRIDPLASTTALATVGIFDQQPTTATTGKLPSTCTT